MSLLTERAGEKYSISSDLQMCVAMESSKSRISPRGMEDRLFVVFVVAIVTVVVNGVRCERRVEYARSKANRRPKY